MVASSPLSPSSQYLPRLLDKIHSPVFGKCERENKLTKKELSKYIEYPHKLLYTKIIALAKDFI